ncbi:degreening-related gene dee76 protein-like isoform X2 [Henckelia pumila]|uniref:degreening-related gene dee76 protein-like isoform X2 n=1 Tax=Henckelia pumila TaxID=405737 RepID=UPI003C6E84BB
MAFLCRNYCLGTSQQLLNFLLKIITGKVMYSVNCTSSISILKKFYAEYNSKLLESSNYITKRQTIKLLGDILLDHSNSAVIPQLQVLT